MSSGATVGYSACSSGSTPVGRSQGLQILDEVGDFLRREPQSEEAVVVVDDGLEVRESAVVVVAPLGMTPEPAQRRGAIAECGRSIGLEVVDADLGGQVQIESRLGEQGRDVAVGAPGLAVEQDVAACRTRPVETPGGRHWRRQGKLILEEAGE